MSLQRDSSPQHPQCPSRLHRSYRPGGDRLNRAPRPGAGPILYLLHGLVGGGVLILPLADGVRLKVELDPAFARLLYAIHKAWEADSHEDPEIRGWRPAERLGNDMGELLANALPISPSAVTKYVWEINRRIRWAAAEDLRPGAPVPKVIESRRCWGYRLGVGDLTVIDRDEK